MVMDVLIAVVKGRLKKKACKSLTRNCQHDGIHGETIISHQEMLPLSRARRCGGSAKRGMNGLRVYPTEAAEMVVHTVGGPFPRLHLNIPH